MAEWMEEKPTHELRWRRERFVRTDANDTLETWSCDTLQQKWEVARGGAGRGVEYSEEWKDVPVVECEND